jgi:SAM-dependent methyltransferase
MNKNYFYKPYTPKDLQELPCAVCSSQDTLPVARENNLHIVRCACCGYIYVNPRPGIAALEDFYREYFPPQEGLAESWGGEMSAIFANAFSYINAHFDGGRILDIGSAYGHFLSQFDGGKWQACGVEPSPIASGYCRRHFPRISTYTSSFEDVTLDAASYDVITSFYVVEHVFDPRDFMQRVYDLLKDGGLAVIRIPYTRPFFPFARLLRRPLMYAPMHLNDFAPLHFERLGRELGFREVATTVGTSRNSTDIVEKLGAAVFGFIGRVYELVAPASHPFPFAGAYTYLLRK